jgi:SAM-dependent methyltransferase
MGTTKQRVRDYWDRSPCGALDAAAFPEGSREFFDEVERQRFSGDDFMPEICRFEAWTGKSVLEVGCGLGTDLIRFARAGANVWGTDLTDRAIRLTGTRFSREDLPATLMVADAERIPFQGDRFDLVYSWGVIHHTPRPDLAARELLRVCRSGGRVVAMVYHRRSLFALQAWIVYALGRGKPWLSASKVIAEHVESPGTRAYSVAEARRLFFGLDQLSIRPVVTRYDVRVGRRSFLPGWVRRSIPGSLGWFLVVEGSKPSSGP